MEKNKLSIILLSDLTFRFNADIENFNEAIHLNGMKDIINKEVKLLFHYEGKDNVSKEDINNTLEEVKQFLFRKFNAVVKEFISTNDETNMITPNEYCQLANRTCAPLEGKTLGQGMADNLHMVLGMATEVGELADPFKKCFAYNKPVDWVNVKEELGDLMWYIGTFCAKNNISLEEVMETNIAKLKARYPDKYSDEAATNRNLDAERDILEKN